LPSESDVSCKSPFLLREFLVQAAQDSDVDLEPIDASRGAANWQQRRVLNAWHALGLYAVSACGTANGDGEVGLTLDPAGPHLEQFERFAAEHASCAEISDGCALLARAWEWLGGEVLTDWPVDRIIYQFAEAVAGRLYPDPPTLDFVAPVLSRYFAPLLFRGDEELSASFRVLTCEGATTGIAQVTSTLARNGIICPGDKVAMWWPTYEPLRDLVECQLGCEIVPIRRDANAGWAVPGEEFERLSDPAIKLVIMVSPGNPVPTVTDSASLDALEQAVAARPELLVLADYVYTHFLDEAVETEIGRMPRNTIGVYSVSKDFGLAGARLGVVLMHEECVAEELMACVGGDDRQAADGRYSRRSLQPATMPLLDRVIADSRGVSFTHMSGVSTPLQALVCLCACYDLTDPGAPAYFGWVRAQLRERLEALHEGLGIDLPQWAGGQGSRYSTVIDLLALARARLGEDSAKRLGEGEVWPFMEYMACQWRVVVTVGEGFGSGRWSVRACFPAVNADQARELGRRVAGAVEEYASGRT